MVKNLDGYKLEATGVTLNDGTFVANTAIAIYAEAMKANKKMAFKGLQKLRWKCLGK